MAQLHLSKIRAAVVDSTSLSTVLSSHTSSGAGTVAARDSLPLPCAGGDRPSGDAHVIACLNDSVFQFDSGMETVLGSPPVRRALRSARLWVIGTCLLDDFL